MRNQEAPSKHNNFCHRPRAIRQQRKRWLDSSETKPSAHFIWTPNRYNIPHVLLQLLLRLKKTAEYLLPTEEEKNILPFGVVNQSGLALWMRKVTGNYHQSSWGANAIPQESNK
ncbi:hypothetical protein AAG906_018365 [Vitis piasezkii]